MPLTEILTAQGTVSVALAMVVLALLWLYLKMNELKARIIRVEGLERDNATSIATFGEKLAKIDVNVEWIKEELKKDTK